MSNTNTKTDKPAGILGMIGAGVSYIALCLTGLAALALVVVPLVTGSQTYSVLTSSMAPKYAPGTFLVVKPVPFEELRVGDIITYQIESGNAAVITHRITSVSAAQNGELQFITKGDNNDAEDELPVREVQVRGKLLYAVPLVGFVANGLGNSDRGAIAQWGAVALMGYGVVTLVRGALAKRRKDDAASDGSSDQGPEAGNGPDAGNDGGWNLPSFDAAGAGFDASDALDYGDPILTDCDGCDHDGPHHALQSRKPVTV